MKEINSQKKDRAMESQYAISKPPPCPMCQSSCYVIAIVYGEPTNKLLQQWSRGEIELGGDLIIDGKQPPWTCVRCSILIE